MTKQTSFCHTFSLIGLLFIPIFGFSQLFEYKQNQKWGLIDQKGEVFLMAQYDRIEASDDRTHFYLYQNGKTGVYHRFKGILSPPRFDHIFPLKHGYYIIADKGKYGIMDTLGKVLSPTKYDRFRQDGMYFYTYSNGKMGLLQPRIGELLSARYDTIFRFDQKYFCSIENKLAGLIDTVGNLIEPSNYHRIRHLYKDWYIVMFEGKWGMKKLGQASFHYPIEYSYIGTFDREEIYIQVTQEKLSRLEDLNRNILIDSIPGRLVDYFGDRYAYTRGKGLGLMDLEAKPLCKPMFSKIRDVHPSFFQITYKGQQGVIDRDGNTVVYPKYSAVKVDSTKHIWAKVGRNWGVLSPKGERIFPPTFHGAGSFQNHVAKVFKIKKDTLQRTVYKRVLYTYEWITETYYVDSTKYGLINQHGEYLAPIEYDNIKVYPKAARLHKYWGSNVSQVAFDSEGRKSNRFMLMVDSSSARYNERKELERAAADTTKVVEADTIPDTFTWVRVKGKWGLQSEKEKIDIWKIRPRYTFIAEIPNTNMTLVGRRRSSNAEILYGLVDHIEGKTITSTQYKKIYIEDFQQEEYARVIEENNLYNIIHQSGKSSVASRRNYLNFWRKYARYNIKMPPTYIGLLRDGWARVRFDGTLLEDEQIGSFNQEKHLRNGGGIWGIMYFDGTFKLKPEYDYIGEAEGATFSFSQRQKWGIMDTSLKTITPLQYDMLEDYDGRSKHFICTYNARKLSVLNIDGKFESAIPLDSQNVITDFADIQDISILSEGMLAFRKAGKWGFINTNGEITIKPTFINVGDFHSGLAKAREQRFWGFINKKGEYVIEPQYKRVDDFAGGIATTNSSKGWKFINQQGERAIKQAIRTMKPFYKGQAIVKSSKSNKWGMIDTMGNWLLEPIYDNIELFEEHYRIKKGNKYGYINLLLTEVIPPTFDNLGKMQEGKVHFRKNRKYGFMNNKGEEVIEPQYGVVLPFSNGLSATRERVLWGFINTRGELAIEHKYTRAKSFQRGVAAVAQKNKDLYGGGLNWGFIDTSGRVIVPLVYRTVRQNKHGILSCLNHNEQWEYFDQYGIPLSHNKYNKASEYKKNWSKVELGDFSYLMDLDAQLVTNPGYNDIISWESPQILAMSQYRKGIIDRVGHEILAADYEQIHFFDGLYQVINNGQVGYLDEKGRWIWPLKD